MVPLGGITLATASPDLRLGRFRSLLLFAAVLLAVGVSSIASAAAHGATSSSAGVAARAPTPKPATARQWAQIVARAKREGEVTLYSTQIPALLADLAKAFEAKYGIKVNVNRQVDNLLVTQINAGFSSGRVLADIWVTNALPYTLGALRNGWVTDAVGPAFFSRQFDRKTYVRPGKAWIPSTAILGYGWNTAFWPRGLNSYTDIVNPALQGRIGVLRPASPAAVDFWYWVRENYGAGFIQRLAALKPKIYVSAVPMQSSLAAGEIAVGAFISATVRDLIAQGAPISFRVPRNAWNTPYYAMILKQAPHPAAAQLLANFMVTREGQAVMTRNAGSVLPDIPNASFVKPRIVKLKDLTPQKITEFQNYWNSLFQ